MDIWVEYWWGIVRIQLKYGWNRNIWVEYGQNTFEKRIKYGWNVGKKLVDYKHILSGLQAEYV